MDNNKDNSLSKGLSGLLPLLQKEFIQIRRNAFLPRLIVLFPIVIMCVMPWVMQMEVKNIVVDVVDIDRSVESGRLVGQIAASNYFIFGGQKATYAEAMKDIEKGRADVILEIRDGKYLIAANAVNGMKGSIGAAYLSQIIRPTPQPLPVMEGSGYSQGLQVSAPSLTGRAGGGSLLLYNKGQNYKLFMIPALPELQTLHDSGPLCHCDDADDGFPAHAQHRG